MLKGFAGALAASVVLAGCAVGGSTDSDPPSGTNADKSSDTKATPKAEAKSKAPVFGEAYTWKGGITIKVSTPQKFTPSEYAAADKANAYIKIGIRLINKSGKPFDPSLVYDTIQSGNEDGSEVFDSGAKIGDTPSTTLLDGREAKWVVAFGVKDPKDLVFEISPDAGLNYKKVIFTY